MKEIIIQSSCLHFSHPAQRVLSSGDYMRVIVEDLETDERTVLFTGEKYDEKNFEEKRRLFR